MGGSTGKQLQTAIFAGVVAGITIASGGTAGLVFGFSWSQAAVGFGLALLAGRLFKPKSPGGGSVGARNRELNVRSTIKARETIYGEMLIGGSLVYVESVEVDGDNNDWLWLVFAIADHQTTDFSEVHIDNKVIDKSQINAATGEVIDGFYRPRKADFSLVDPIVYIRFYNGEQTEADPWLLSRPNIDANFIGKGMTYAVVRLKNDIDKFPTGLPNVAFKIRGKKVVDVRDGVRKYSVNPALMLYDYLTTPVNALAPGLGVSEDDINKNDFIAAANACEATRGVATTATEYELVRENPNYIYSLKDENVLPFYRGQSVEFYYGTGSGDGQIGYVVPLRTLDGIQFAMANSFDDAINNQYLVNPIAGFTHVRTRDQEERKFYASGIADSSESAANTLESLVEACAGRLSVVGGYWRFNVGVWQPPAPTATLDENSIISPITLRPRAGINERFNIIEGIFVPLAGDGKPTNYQPYEEAHTDTKRIPYNLDLEFVATQASATTITKIMLRRQKHEMTFNVEVNLTALRWRPGDVISVSNARFGWVNKTFEIVQWIIKTKVEEDVPITYIDLSLRETSPSIYTIDDNEFYYVRHTRTNLPDPFRVPLPVLVQVATESVETQRGDYTFELTIAWTSDTPGFILSGGRYEVEWQLSPPPPDYVDDWIAANFVSGELSKATLNQVSPLRFYDVRIRAVNVLGVHSRWLEIRNFRPSGRDDVATLWDLRYISESVVDTYDMGVITGKTDDTIDLGDIRGGN